jgi:chaperone required for assembly of F1-ATPase
VKRFYKTAEARDGAILLDGRPVRTPARAALVLPNPALADAVVAEWTAQGEDILPASMPLTGLANAAIDRVASDPATFAAGLAEYAKGDLLCYRAEGPDSLVAAQVAAWDPPLDWARARYDVHFAITTGIVHVDQPAETIARLGAAVAARDAFTLAGLSPLVTISGSLVLSLMVTERAIDPDAAFDTAHLDELWQVGRWGEDALATEARENRRRDFNAAARYVGLL